MNTFLITGYPRSRTAWLSNLLTYGPSFCLHEPGLQFRCKQFPSLFHNVGTPYAGVSEARAIIYFDQFMDLFPDSKVVVVKRNKADVINSLKRHGLDFEMVSDLYDEKLAQIEKHGISVPFEGLNGAEVWNYCIPEHPINKIRLRMLEQFNISLTPEAMQRHGQPILK